MLFTKLGKNSWEINFECSFGQDELEKNTVNNQSELVNLILRRNEPKINFGVWEESKITQA